MSRVYEEGRLDIRWIEEVHRTINQGFSVIMARPAHRVGPGQEIFKSSRFDLGRVRRCPEPHGAGRGGSGQEFFQVSRVTLT